MKLRETTTHCPNCEPLAERLARLEAWSFKVVDRVDRLEEEAASLRQESERLNVENEVLREENLRLKQQLAAARKDSSTSSKPPSSDIVKPPKPAPKDGKKRQRGGQPGHEQHLRDCFPDEAINHVVPYTLDCCPDCGGKLQSCKYAADIQQQVEIVSRPIIVTEHQA